MKPSSYIGHRIPWEPSSKPSQAVGDSRAKDLDNFIVADENENGNDSDAYEPMSITVKTRTKGKGKAKEIQQKEDKKMRKQLESTGVVREKSCKRCERLKQSCFIQKEGAACFACAVVKMKYEEPVEGENVEKKKRAMKPAMKPATQRAK